MGPHDYGFLSEADGPGYEDKRIFVVKEEGTQWKLEARWSATGTGPIPRGIGMLASMAPVFNSLFNMMVGMKASNQRTQQIGNARPQSPFSLLFGPDEEF